MGMTKSGEVIVAGGWAGTTMSLGMDHSKRGPAKSAI